MTLVRYNNRLPRFFDDFFTRDMDHFFGGEADSNLPAVNVQEDDNGFAVEVAAPGFEKNDFKVEIDQNTLTIAADKETKNEDSTDAGYVKREFRSQAFRRSFRLPENTVDGDKIEARYEAGILHLTLPKREEVKPKPARMIEIG